MKKRIFYYLKEVIFVIVFMSVIANILSIYKSQNLNKEILSINSFKIINNTDYNIENSKPLVIHFWASWCPICKFEAANIEYLSKYYNVVTIAVDSGSDYDLSKYLQEKDLDLLVVNDKNKVFSKQFNIQAYPTTLIYDKNKNLIFSEVGYTSTIGLFLRMWWIEFLK